MCVAQVSFDVAPLPVEDAVPRRNEVVSFDASPLVAATNYLRVGRVALEPSGFLHTAAKRCTRDADQQLVLRCAATAVLLLYYKSKPANVGVWGEEGGRQSRDLIPGGATLGILWF